VPIGANRLSDGFSFPLLLKQILICLRAAQHAALRGFDRNSELNLRKKKAYNKPEQPQKQPNNNPTQKEFQTLKNRQ
jgi:hypothetical protein